jgi:hypothetical protein
MLELFCKSLGLEFHLLRIVNVLVMAAPTHAKMRAARGDAQRGRLQNLNQFCSGMPTLFFDQTHAHLFTRQAEGDKAGAAIGKAGKSITTIHKACRG